MQLQVTVDNTSSSIEIPDQLLIEGEAFFQKMDNDMDRGWQMGPEYVEQPDLRNRCQIAADKLLQAIDTNNHNLLLLMAGYILKRMPGVKSVNINTSGEMLNTEFVSKNS